MTAHPGTEWGQVAHRFERFISWLTPEADELEAAQANAAAVAGALRVAFRPLDTLLAGEFPGAGASDYIIAGGVGKGLAIRPLDAVDVFYVLPPALRHRARPGIERDGNDAPLAAELTGAIEARFPGARIRTDTWITVELPQGPLVRLLPVFPFAGAPAPDATAGGEDDAENNGSAGFLVGRPFGARALPESTDDARDPGESNPDEMWRFAHPAAEVRRLAEADRVSGDKATHLIRMLKAWRRTHGVPIPSLALETLVTEFVQVWNYQRRSHLFYDWMVRDCFFWLCYQGGRRLRLPGTGERLALGESWLATSDMMFAHAREACRLERDNRNADAVQRWRAIFGEAYGAPASETRPPKRTATVVQLPTASTS